MECEEQVENRFGFAGELYDPVSALVYLRARFYNPVIGRFLQEDNVYEDGLNLYVYCRNNPVRYVDPSGHGTESPADKDGNSSTDSKIFSNWEDMKKAYYRTVTKFVKENKPKYSPNIKKWFENGGSIEIKTVDGKQVWTYISASGEAVPYIDGYIKFPDQYLHPEIKSIDIGEFTGDRGKDLQKAMEILKRDYNITKIPEGYVVHHDTQNGILQLVDKNIHKKFTHIGGHSIYK